MPDESCPYPSSQFHGEPLQYYLPLRLDLRKNLFISGHQTKTLYTLLMSSMRATYPGNLILLDIFALIIFYEEYIF
jgi:hypothetical protein